MLLGALDDACDPTLIWSANGTEVVITHWPTFLSSTLPKHFPTMGAGGSNKTKHASFLKALNAYGKLQFSYLEAVCSLLTCCLLCVP